MAVTRGIVKRYKSTFVLSINISAMFEKEFSYFDVIVTSYSKINKKNLFILKNSF